MRLYDIIKRNSWSSVKGCFYILYPNFIQNIGDYEKVFNEILLLKPEKSEMLISVSKTLEKENNKYYFDVSGYLPMKKREYKKRFSLYSIAHISWDEWLGMGIRDNSGYVCSEPEFICHCLWEMTYHSFDQNEIKKLSKMLSGRAKKICSAEDKEKYDKDKIAREKIKKLVRRKKKKDIDD